MPRCNNIVHSVDHRANAANRAFSLLSLMLRSIRSIKARLKCEWKHWIVQWTSKLSVAALKHQASNIYFRLNSCFDKIDKSRSERGIRFARGSLVEGEKRFRLMFQSRCWVLHGRLRKTHEKEIIFPSCGRNIKSVENCILDRMMCCWVSGPEREQHSRKLYFF